MEKIVTDIFKDLPRQGPGEKAATLKALSYIPKHAQGGVILDIGCGTGAQTFTLLEATHAKVIALDNNEEFIEELLRLGRHKGYGDRINGMVETMHNIRLPHESVDIIWCEGAIYHITPEEGLLRWKPLLKPSGYFAFTDLCWVKPNPPEAVRKYWKGNYPAMKSMDDIMKLIVASGYELLTSFTLSQSAWRENYYDLIEEKMQAIEGISDSFEATELFDALREEMQIFDEYGDYYNYGFFVAKKLD